MSSVPKLPTAVPARRSVPATSSRWDSEQEGRVPLLVINGRDISWKEFGRILMTYEGFQFKLEIRDRSKEV